MPARNNYDETRCRPATINCAPRVNDRQSCRVLQPLPVPPTGNDPAGSLWRIFSIAVKTLVRISSIIPDRSLSQSALHNRTAEGQLGPCAGCRKTDATPAPASLNNDSGRSTQWAANDEHC